MAVSEEDHVTPLVLEAGRTDAVSFTVSPTKMDA